MNQLLIAALLGLVAVSQAVKVPANAPKQVDDTGVVWFGPLIVKNYAFEPRSYICRAPEIKPGNQSAETDSVSLKVSRHMNEIRKVEASIQISSIRHRYHFNKHRPEGELPFANEQFHRYELTLYRENDEPSQAIVKLSGQAGSEMDIAEVGRTGETAVTITQNLAEPANVPHGDNVKGRLEIYSQDGRLTFCTDMFDQGPLFFHRNIAFGRNGKWLSSCHRAGQLIISPLAVGAKGGCQIMCVKNGLNPLPNLKTREGIVGFAVNEGKQCPLNDGTYDNHWLNAGVCNFGECVANSGPAWPPQPVNSESWGGSVGSVAADVDNEKIFVNMVIAYADLPANVSHKNAKPYVAVYVNSLESDPICVSPFLDDPVTPEWTFKCAWRGGQVSETDQLHFAVMDAAAHPQAGDFASFGSIDVATTMKNIKYEPAVELSPGGGHLSISYEMVRVHPTDFRSTTH